MTHILKKLVVPHSVLLCRVDKRVFVTFHGRLRVPTPKSPPVDGTLPGKRGCLKKSFFVVMLWNEPSHCSKTIEILLPTSSGSG